MHGFPNVFFGKIVPARLFCDETKQMPTIAMVGIDSQNLNIKLFSLA